MATSNRSNSGAYDTLWTNTLERWLNNNSFEDTVFLHTPTLAVLTNDGSSSELTNTLAVRLGNARGAGVEAFSYYDTVNTNPTKGTQAANFQVANYSGPVALSWQEKLELNTPQKIASHANYVMSTQSEEMRERLGTDIYRGSVANSKQILGFEQMLPDYTHDKIAGNNTVATAITDPITKRFQMKQAANSYGGIQRVAWLGDAAPGTYWEGNAADFFQSAFAFDGTNGAMNAALQRLENVVAMASYGGERPDAMFSSYRPWQDYMNAASTKQQVTRGSGMIDANVSFQNVMYKGLTWFWDDFCKTYNVFEASTAGEDNIYMINSKKTRLETDSRANFTLTEERTPTNQHAGVKHLLWRGQLVNENPRSSARIFSYGA